jgi:hypothetical protein
MLFTLVSGVPARSESLPLLRIQAPNRTLHGVAARRPRNLSRRRLREGGSEARSKGRRPIAAETRSPGSFERANLSYHATRNTPRPLRS